MKQIMTTMLAATLLFSCGGGRKEGDTDTAKRKVVPDRYTYSVTAEYPHSRTSYTQGLQFVDGILWESTGNYGKSQLQRVDIETGETDIVAKLPSREFGEGMTVLGGRIWWLTWRNGKARIYDRQSGKQVDEAKYKGEGWGLTSNGKMLYMSDGTDRIRVIDPENFEQKGTISVVCNGESLDYLNELEWIDGKIWANIYTLNQIVIINPADGIVEGIVDLTGILPLTERDESTDVLNGIAWDAEQGRIFVTGKNWSKLYQIEVFKR